jgi:hypothetical protein
MHPGHPNHRLAHRQGKPILFAQDRLFTLLLAPRLKQHILKMSFRTIQGASSRAREWFRLAETREGLDQPSTMLLAPRFKQQTWESGTQ